MVQTPYRPHQRKRRAGNLKPQFPYDKRQLFGNLHGWLRDQRTYRSLRGHNV